MNPLAGMQGIVISLFVCFFWQVRSQENIKNITAYEDYSDELLNPDDEYLATLEEWQDMITQWLENPLCINNEEATWLMEYKIISLYQLNKLKEYRYMYGNLLSVYELAFIEGWDFQTVRKVIPLVTVMEPRTIRPAGKFTITSFRHSLLLKTSFNTYASKGYKKSTNEENIFGEPVYSGPPFRLAIRYDLEYRNKLALGVRAEKDPGEPLLISDNSVIKNLKTPDLMTGYLQIKNLGPLKSVILGNYRVNFGYGVNLSSGQSAIKSRNGMSGMAHQVRPQRSVSETGFYRGIALSAEAGKFIFTGFGSVQKLDGTSIITDSVSGKPISFSSINRTGLHRTLNELANRKTISETTAGGYIVYYNNWLKSGLIAIYNRFNATIVKGGDAYTKFDMKGRENLVTGLSATIWLPGIQFFTESSVSKNKGFALISGLQIIPVPGILAVVTYRHFDVDYQNWNGSGFVSSGRNSAESGLQISMRGEMARKWLIELTSDLSEIRWITYGLKSPVKKREIRLIIEKAWPHARSLGLTCRYLNNSRENPVNSYWITHPDYMHQYKFRAEGRIEVKNGIKLKSRIEYTLMEASPPGWLIFQDIEFTLKHLNTRIWLRSCLFDAQGYENSIYAYENDVLYDFTSFLHYGKGLRAIIMARVNLHSCLDMWLRISTVYYTNKKVGSGWDELEGNRQNEIEIQVRLKIPG